MGTLVLDTEKGTLRAGVYLASFSARSAGGRLVGVALTLEDFAVSVIQEVLTKQPLRAAVLRAHSGQCGSTSRVLAVRL